VQATPQAGATPPLTGEATRGDLVRLRPATMFGQGTSEPDQLAFAAAAGQRTCAARPALARRRHEKQREGSQPSSRRPAPRKQSITRRTKPARAGRVW